MDVSKLDIKHQRVSISSREKELAAESEEVAGVVSDEVDITELALDLPPLVNREPLQPPEYESR